MKPLSSGVIYILIVIVLGTAGYLLAGWNMSDASYMVIITLFTVGYEEVHPIASPALRALTITLIVLGCTGIIYLTGAVVQFFTATQLQNLLGLKRMKKKWEGWDECRRLKELEVCANCCFLGPSL